MKSFFRSYRFRLLVTLVLSPLVTVGFFVFFGYGSFVEQMEARSLSAVSEQNRLQAHLLEKEFEKYSVMVSAAFHEVQENKFNGESSVFNSNDSFAFFEVRESLDGLVRFQRTHPEFHINFKDLLNDFLIAENSLVNQAGRRYLVINKIFQQTKIKATGVFQLQERVIASDEKRLGQLVISELGEIVDGHIGAFDDKILQSIREKFVNIHEGKPNGVKKLYLPGLGMCALSFNKIFGSTDYIVSVVPGKVLKAQNQFLLRNFLLLMITILCGVLIMGLFLSNHLTRSLSQLNNAAKRLGRGEFDLIVTVPGKDEIGQLADQMTSMARQISDLFVDQKKKTILEQELKTAQLVQENFVPASEKSGGFYQISCFYRSAVQVGGDWWQVKDFDQGRAVDIFLGDATGHGPAAAMVTSAASAMSQAIDYKRQWPLENFINSFDFYTMRTFKQHVYMTMFFGRLTPGKIEYYLAGHEPGLWLKSNGEVDFLAMDWATPHIGSGKTVREKPIVRNVSPGDVFVIFSDGLFELKTHKNRHLQIGRLYDWLRKIDHSQMSAHQIRNFLAKKLIPLIPRDGQQDDIVLLVVKVL